MQRPRIDSGRRVWLDLRQCCLWGTAAGVPQHLVESECVTAYRSDYCGCVVPFVHPRQGLPTMNNNKLKAIACTISRGGFSDERIFRLNAGGVNHEGLASRRHMWKADGSPIQEGEPPLGRTVKGLVAARLLELVDASTALVSLPDGETAKVPTSELRDRPAAVGQHVPV